MTIQEGLKEFYAINYFDDDGGTQNAWAWLKVGPISVPMPNPESRKKALYLHDINHLITGYSTKWVGETSISGWELATGGWGTNLFVWMIIMGGFMIGVVIYPVSTFKAFIRGRHCRAVASLNMKKSELLSLKINDLKTRTGLNDTSEHPATFIDILDYIRWILTALVTYLLPMVLVGWLVMQFIF